MVEGPTIGNEYQRENPFEAEWKTLTEEEQEACQLFSASEWGAVDMPYIEMCEISPTTLVSLIDKKIVQRQEGKEFVQEFIDENKEKWEAIQMRGEGDLSQDELNFKITYKSAQRQLEDLRPVSEKYRLKSKAFHDFAKSKMQE